MTVKSNLVKLGVDITGHHKTKLSHDEFVRELNKVWGEGHYSVLGTYQGLHKPVLVEHVTCGNKYDALPSSLLRNHGCKVCANKSKVKSHEEFVQDVDIFYGKGVFTVTSEYTGSQKYVSVRHNACGYERSVKPETFLKRCEGVSSVCPKCSNRLQKTTEDYVTQVKALVGDEYTVLDEYVKSGVKIAHRHNYCGFVWHIEPRQFLYGKRCPYCRTSRGEKKIYTFLTSCDIKTVPQMWFNDLYDTFPLRFDFAVYRENSLYCLIEYDGQQHFRPVFGDEAFIRTTTNDKRKTDYCCEKGIKLIRIPYTEFDHIEEILSRELSDFIEPHRSSVNTRHIATSVH